MKMPTRRRIGLGLLVGSVALSITLWLCGLSVVTFDGGGGPGWGWEIVHITWAAPIFLVTGLLGLTCLVWPSRARPTGGAVSE